MRQAAVHSCLIVSIIICVYHVITKIKFQLGKLVHKLVSESEKSRFRALEIQNLFSRASMPPVSPR